MLKYAEKVFARVLNSISEASKSINMNGIYSGYNIILRLIRIFIPQT